jgi:hypothetical protein
MRCHFNLVSSTEKLIDHEGIEVRDLDQAWAQALRAIEELRSEDGDETEDWDNWVLEVTDSAGLVLFSVSLTGSRQ